MRKLFVCAFLSITAFCSSQDASLDNNDSSGYVPTQEESNLNKVRNVAKDVNDSFKNMYDLIQQEILLVDIEIFRSIEYEFRQYLKSLQYVDLNDEYQADLAIRTIIKFDNKLKNAQNYSSNVQFYPNENRHSPPISYNNSSYTAPSEKYDNEYFYKVPITSEVKPSFETRNYNIDDAYEKSSNGIYVAKNDTYKSGGDNEKVHSSLENEDESFDFSNIIIGFLSFFGIMLFILSRRNYRKY